MPSENKKLLIQALNSFTSWGALAASAFVAFGSRETETGAAAARATKEAKANAAAAAGAQGATHRRSLLVVWTIPTGHLFPGKVFKEGGKGCIATKDCRNSNLRYHLLQGTYPVPQGISYFMCKWLRCIRAWRIILELRDVQRLLPMVIEASVTGVYCCVLRSTHKEGQLLKYPH